MIPGKMNSREMKRMMAQMGIKSDEMPDVKTVILKGTTKDYVISNAQVMMIEARGEKTFQIVGNMKEVPKSAAEKEIAVPQYNEDDLRLVIDQTGVSREKAIEALKKANGQPAQAIIDLTGQ
ncbi:MAG: nascent polypeptide-associated complex protein [Thermoplasmataceae archaeon]|jgi:nascent polypeptide-associated complex subunit alpha|nr:nascent polypeptide-associated complex protein [Candidatus Thermoplasmatota archaeon]